MGKNLIFVPECHSTNTLALELSQLPATADGTVIISDHQTAGRGQRGNTWEAEPGRNLTFSVVLRPVFLSVKDQFFLNIFAALAIHDFLKQHSISARIKWPNDLLFGDKKLSGILIENQIRGAQVSASIIGIGLNVNQKQFGSPKATSIFNLISTELILPDALESMLALLEKRYLQLKGGRLKELKTEYLDHLYGRNETHSFVSNSEVFSGTITGINDEGRLVIETGEGVRTFDVKQVSFAA